MKLLGCFSKILFASAAVLSRANGQDAVSQEDIEALREFINTKRQVTIKEIGGSLSISGEVRTEFQATNETERWDGAEGRRWSCRFSKSRFRR